MMRSLPGYWKRKNQLRARPMRMLSPSSEEPISVAGDLWQLESVALEYSS